MEYEWDPVKAKVNLEKHGVSFEFVTRFDWSSVHLRLDTRHREEQRVIALGLIGERLYSLVFTERTGNVRIISLRKANNREMKNYAEAKAETEYSGRGAKDQ